MGFLAPSPPALPAVAPAPPPVLAGGPVQGAKPGPRGPQATMIASNQFPGPGNLASPTLMGSGMASVNPANTGRATLLGG